MKPINASEAKYMPMTIFHQDAIYTEDRIDRATVPKGLYIYDTRHNDNGDWVTPVTVEDKIVTVNFCGTLITKKPVTFRSKKDRCRNIDHRSYRYKDGPAITLEEFINDKR